MLLAGLLAAASSPPASAVGEGALLPVSGYSMADGLVSDSEIGGLLVDSRGYLWISTSSGLSRFDGRRFVNYFAGTHAVSRVIEDADGALWAGTDDGLYRLDPEGSAGGPAFRQMHPAPVSAIHQDRHGTIWTGHRDELARIEIGADGAVSAVTEHLEFPYAWFGGREVNAIDDGSDGSLWVATNWGLLRRLPDGRHLLHRLGPGLSSERIFALEIDDRGLIWFGDGSRLFVLFPDSPVRLPDDGIIDGLLQAAMQSTSAPVAGGEVSLPSRPGEIHLYGPGHGMPGGVFFGSIDQAGDGRILIGGPFGLTIFEGNRFETLGPERGVSEHVTAAMPDRQGNIWIGTGHRGILRLASRGFESWRRQEGLASDQPAALGEDRDGSPVVMTRRSPLSHSGVGVSLQRWNGTGFEEVDLPWPHLDDPGWGWGSLFTQDDRGRWWIATGQGLLELPSGRLLHAGNGLAGGEVFRLFHDAEGVLWVSTFPEPGTLTRIDPRGGPPKIFTGDEGWPAVTPTAFAEDADGTKWFGLYDRGLVRYRGGKFTLFRDDERLPRGMVGAIIAEAPDDLWVAIDGGGLVRARIAPDDGVAAESWTVDRGLSSNRVLSLARDGKGRLFVGTDRGVDLLDPSTGRVESFGSDDGLAGTFVNVAWVSRQGDRWFGTRTGLSRYLPGPAGAPPPPTVLIHELLIDGAPAPMPSLGAAGVTGPAIPPGQRRVSIGYSAIGLTAGRSLRFQYRMEGLDDGWSPATDQLTAEYASLAPGRYTFVVRALEGGVAAVGEPATVTLAIPAPLSQRWWFRAILGLAVGLAIYLLYRMRLSRMVALERQRTRIAMDLHDEIGSGLGSIGLLADMAGAGALDQERLAGLTRAIGDTASELGTALGDIVGTLRPGGAMLEAMARQLADRGRRLFPGSGATLTISMPASWPSRPLSLALCRSLFLIGVEALHNAARHAGAEAVSLELAREGRRWRLTVRDDGRGLPGESPPRDDGGSGLIGMRRRAAEIGAELRIRSAPGGGTEITVIFDPSTGSSAPEPERQVI